MQKLEPKRFKILIATNVAHLPQVYGGANVSSHELAQSLLQRGHKAAVFAHLHPSGIVYWVNRLKRALTSHNFPSDQTLGYAVYRGWGSSGSASLESGLAEVIERYRPDVVLVNGGQSINLASVATALHLPTLVYLRDVEFDELSADPLTIGGVTYLANSNFTAVSFYSKFGLTAIVIPPLVSHHMYCVESSRKCVLFVNPNQKKGLHIAVALATARPDIDFLFQESWILSELERRALTLSISGLKNVRLCESTADMRGVYRQTRVVLAPSQWNEAWGRVATEAHISGIPVIGSDRGGLPESIGDGGIIVPFDSPISTWLEALSSMWDNKAVYAHYQAKAIESSKRLSIQPEFLMSKLEAAIEYQVDARSKSV